MEEKELNLRKIHEITEKNQFFIIENEKLKQELFNL